jgi:CubicO group peptidase (beta-lactamase class C family)
MIRGVIRSFFCFAVAMLMVLILATNTSLRATVPPSRTVTENVEQYLENAVQQWHIPGLAVAIVKGDQVFYTKGFGRSDAQHQITSDTPFIIGSLSKSLTATAILQLVETGKIDLQASIQQYLPWFRLNSKYTNPIKIADLLHHTSGLSIQTDMEYLDWSVQSSPHSLENYVRRLTTAKPVSPAGTKFNYSNANYAILGLVIQQIAKMPYEKYIESHIFQPLEMNHSFTSQGQALHSLPPLSTGHRFWLNQPVATTVPFDQQNLPAGYLISSAKDIAHYLIMQLNRGQYQDKMLISAASLAQLHEPAVLAWGNSTYAMGWVNDQVNNVSIKYHGGELANFSANATLIPSQRWGIVILTNVFPGLIGDPIRKLYVGVINILQGSNPPQLHIELSNKILVFGLPLILLGQIGLLLRSFSQKIQPSLLKHQLNRRYWWMNIYSPAILHSSIAIGFLVVLPLGTQVPLSIMLLAQPDIAITAIGCGTVAACSLVRVMVIGWSVKKLIRAKNFIPQ